MPAPLRSLRSARPLPSAALACGLLVAAAAPAPAEEYKNAGHAAGIGFGLLSARDYDAAREPLEAAREMLLADGDARLRDFQLRSVQRGLMLVYAKGGEPERLFEAGDWLARRTDPEHDATLRMTVGTMVGAVSGDRKGRAKLRKKYETALEENAEDRVALLALSGVAEADEDLGRAQDYLGRLIAVDRESAGGARPRDLMSYARLVERSGDRAAAAMAYEALSEEAETAENDRAFAPSSAGRLALTAAQHWRAAGDDANARRAAERASRIGDVGLDGAMSYYFHDWLGDLWVDLGEPAKAVPHFKRAIEVTTIDGYRTSSRGALADAEAALAARPETDGAETDEPMTETAEPDAEKAKADKAAARKARKAAARAARRAKKAGAEQSGDE